MSLLAFQTYYAVRDVHAVVGTLNLSPTGNVNLPGNSIWKSDGTVGIGTTTPTTGYALEINGDVRLGGGSATYRIRNVAAPTSDGDLSTKGYAETQGDTAVPAGTLLPYGGSSAPTGWLLANGAAVSRTTYSRLFAVVGTTYGAGDGSTTFNLPDLQGRSMIGLDATQTEFDALNETGGSKTHTLTEAQMPVHNHGSTGTESADHSHSMNFNSGTVSSWHTHSFDTGWASHNHTHNSGIGGNFTIEGAGGFGWVGSGCCFNRTGSTTGFSSSHYHSGSTGNPSANHSHTVSGSTGGRSAAHSHATVNTGSGSAHNILPPYRVVNHIIKF